MVHLACHGVVLHRYHQPCSDPGLSIRERERYCQHGLRGGVTGSTLAQAPRRHHAGHCADHAWVSVQVRSTALRLFLIHPGPALRDLRNSSEQFCLSLKRRMSTVSCPCHHTLRGHTDGKSIGVARDRFRTQDSIEDSIVLPNSPLWEILWEFQVAAYGGESGFAPVCRPAQPRHCARPYRPCSVAPEPDGRHEPIIVTAGARGSQQLLPPD